MGVIAKYKFNNTIYDLFPTFNEDFTYTYEDIVEGNGTTRTISSGSIPTDIKFSNDGKGALIEVLELDISGLTSMVNLFNECTRVTRIECSEWDTSKVTNMSGIFNNCRQLTTFDVSNWDTHNVTNMAHMFYNIRKINELDLSNWDVANVKTFSSFIAYSDISKLILKNWVINNDADLRYFSMNSKLNIIDISGWKNITTNTFNTFFSTLTDVILHDSNYSVVNIVISNLAARTEDSPGTLHIEGIDDISQVNIEAANVKYWNVIHDSIVDVKPSLVINPQKPKKNLIIGNYKIMYKNKRLYDNLK